MLCRDAILLDSAAWFNPQRSTLPLTSCILKLRSTRNADADQYHHAIVYLTPLASMLNAAADTHGYCWLL
jgi:hypothetical protein